MEDYNKIIKIIHLCKESRTFIFDGMLVKGLKVDTVKKYVSENPSKRFRTWLIDTNSVIDENYSE